MTVNWDEETFTNTDTQNVSLVLKGGGLLAPKKITIADFYQNHGSHVFSELSANTLYMLVVTQYNLENGNIVEYPVTLHVATSRFLQ